MPGHQSKPSKGGDLITRVLTTAAGVVAAAILAATASPVHAAEAGDWIVRGGLTYISAEEDTANRNGELGRVLDDTDVNIASEAGFGGTLSYMVDDNIGFELLVGTPFKHNLSLDGGELKGANLGSIKHLAPTLSAIYEFDNRQHVGQYQHALHAHQYHGQRPHRDRTDQREGRCQSGGLYTDTGVPIVASCNHCGHGFNYDRNGLSRQAFTPQDTEWQPRQISGAPALIWINVSIRTIIYDQ